MEGGQNGVKTRQNAGAEAPEVNELGGPNCIQIVYIIGILARSLPAYTLRKWVYTNCIHNVIHPILGPRNEPFSSTGTCKTRILGVGIWTQIWAHKGVGPGPVSVGIGWWGTLRALFCIHPLILCHSGTPYFKGPGQEMVHFRGYLDPYLPMDLRTF